MKCPECNHKVSDHNLPGKICSVKWYDGEQGTEEECACMYYVNEVEESTDEAKSDKRGEA